MDIQIYGIRNCDTMKKAFAWLDSHHIAYTFHDYKKSGMDADVLIKAMEQHTWHNVINRKGTSWRALPDDIKASMNAANAIEAAKASPSLIRRPLLKYGKNIYLGFTEQEYAVIFKTEKHRDAT